MNAVFRRLTILTAFVLVCAYGYIALRGPQGIPALIEKRREIRALEEQNADLKRDIEYRRERIRRLKDSASEQEQEIRKRLHLLRPGETQFVLPEQPKQSSGTPATPSDTPRTNPSPR